MKKNYTSVHELDGIVPLKQAIPLGMQHVLAMFVGNVSPLLVIAGIIGMDSGMLTSLVQNAMFIAGIATLIQLYPICGVGSGLPVVMGTSSGFVGMASAGASLGYGSIMGASLVGSLIETVIGFFIKPIRKFFPPVVTGLVVLSIGLKLIPVGINYFVGGYGVPDVGSLENLFLGFLVLLLIVGIKQFTKGFMSASAILIAIVIGYIVAAFMGKVDFAPVASAAWFSLPNFMPVAFSFHLEAIIPMAIMYVATAVETIGDTSGVTQGGLGRDATDKELSGSVLLDGIGSFVASFFGVLPNTSFSQNVGLVAMTKVVNKFAIMTGAVFLILCGFIPKLGALITAIPESVLGGATLVMFSMIAVSGLQLLFKEDLNGRSGIIIAVALGLSIGIPSVPNALQSLPQFVQLVFSSDSIVISFVVSVLLNIILPKDKVKETISE